MTPRMITVSAPPVASNATRSASAPAAIMPLPASRSSRAGLDVNAGSASESGMPRRQQCAQRLEQCAGRADIHAADAALRVEAGQAAARVRADRDAVGRRAAGEVTLQALAAEYASSPSSTGKAVRSTTQPAWASSTASANRRLAAIHVRRVEDACRNLALLQGASHEFEPARTVAKVQVQDAALPVISPATWVSAARRRISSSVGWLERWSLIASSPMPSNGSSSTRSLRTLPVECREWHVIAARVTEGVQSFFAQRIERREQLARTARDVVRAEQADHRRDSGERVARQRYRRHARPESGFAATTGDVHVSVDQAGDQTPARRGRVPAVVVASAARQGSASSVLRAEPEDLAAADKERLQAQRVRGEDIGVAK